MFIAEEIENKLTPYEFAMRLLTFRGSARKALQYIEFDIAPGSELWNLAQEARQILEREI